MFVKICGITNEEDALAATALGADAVGFIFVPSKRQVTFGGARDIIRRLPMDVLPVGVFRDEDPDRVIKEGLRAGIRAVQLHGHETPAMARRLRAHFSVIIVALSAGDFNLGRFDEYQADALLLDAPSPGSGEVFDWKLAEGLPQNRRVILAGGLTPENVAMGIETVRPWGVDVASGVEASPGVKDLRKVQRFIRNARAADNEAWHEDRPGPFDWSEEL